MLELYPDNHLSFIPSLVTAALCLLGPFAASIVAWRRHWRLRRQQRSERERFSEPLPALAPGACVLKGFVEYCQGSSKALVQEIVQKGETLDYATESNDPDTKRHKWTEIERVTHAEPFYVADVRGQRIRVEPGDDVRLGGLQEALFGLHKSTRMMVRELSAGTEVYVAGTLVEAADAEAKPSDYRSAARGWVLRPEAGELLYVGRTEPSSRFDAALRWSRSLLGVTLACFVIFAALLSPYAASLIFGETVSGRVQIKSGRDVMVEHSGGSRWERFDAEDARRITEGQRMAVRRAPPWAISRIAPEASLSAWFLPGMLASWLIFVVLFRRQPQPGSDKVESEGSGPLPNALHAYPLAIREPARAGDSRYRKAQ
jgi:hypothetical protein